MFGLTLDSLDDISKVLISIFSEFSIVFSNYTCNDTITIKSACPSIMGFLFYGVHPMAAPKPPKGPQISSLMKGLLSSIIPELGEVEGRWRGNCCIPMIQNASTKRG